MPPLRKAGLAVLGLLFLAAAGWALLFFTHRQQVAEQRPAASCQADLATALMAQQRFHADRGRFADDRELGLSLVTIFHRAEGPDAAALEQLQVGRTAEAVVLACRADGAWWTISTRARSMGAKQVPAGAVFRH